MHNTVIHTEFVTIETDKQMKISKVTHGALRQLTVVAEFWGAEGWRYCTLQGLCSVHLHKVSKMHNFLLSGSPLIAPQLIFKLF